MISLLEISEPVAATGMEAVTAGVTAFVTVIGTAITAMTTQPLIALFLGAGVFSAALGGFAHMKRAAR